MGWVWTKEPDSGGSGEFRELGNANPRSDGGRCCTRKVVRSQCKTEEDILRGCVGRPVEVVQSNKEYTEDDVTDQVLKGSFPTGSSEQGALDFPGLRSDIDAIARSFNFPGLRGDIEAIERSFFGGLDRFFEAAEQLKNGFFRGLGGPHIFDGDSSSSSASKSRGVPIESDPEREAYRTRNKPKSGHVDLSGLARDV